MPNLEQLADQMLEVYKTKEPTNFLSEFVFLSEDEAYTVQQLTVQKKCTNFKEQVQGFKVSMTSPATQAFFDADEPAYGTLTTNSVLKNGTTVYLSELNEPLLEVELIIELTEDIPSGLSPNEIFERIKIRAGLEIPDSRFSDWFPKFELTDLMADNGVTGYVVISENTVEKLSFNELANIKMKLYHDDEEISDGISSEVMGHPIKSLSWLVDKLDTKGISLTKGMLISSGTFISPIPLTKGTYKAIFDKIGSVHVTVKTNQL